MNKGLKILLAVVGVVVVGIAAVFYFLSGMTTVADDFFSSVGNNDMDKAYSYLSEDFKSSTSKEQLRQFLEKHSLTNFKESHWASRSISGGNGKVSGSVTTESGGVIPITLRFVKEEAGWRIYSIQKPPSGIQERDAPIQAPSEEDQVKLVADAMHVFALSVNDKSMAKLYSHLSNLWQRQATIEQLDKAFASFYDLGVDLTVLDGMSPRFSSRPAVDDDGVLLITGLYPTTPNQVHFEQRFVYEGLSWKLVGFSAEIK
ncbi:MAG: hypothetical protein WAL83_15370 [Arenicellales bacterium]